MQDNSPREDDSPIGQEPVEALHADMATRVRIGKFSPARRDDGASLLGALRQPNSHSPFAVHLDAVIYHQALRYLSRTDTASKRYARVRGLTWSDMNGADRPIGIDTRLHLTRSRRYIWGGKTSGIANISWVEQSDRYHAGCIMPRIGARSLAAAITRGLHANDNAHDTRYMDNGTSHIPRESRWR